MQSKLLSRSSSKKSDPQSESKIYDSCSTLPLYNFIQITLTDDLKWLIVSGNPGNLTEAWAVILGEFSDMSASVKTENAFKLRKRVTFLSNKIDIVNILLNRLSLGHIAKAVDILTRLGFGFKFENFVKYKDQVEKRLNNDRAKLRIASNDLNELIKDDGNKVTLKDWEDELFELAKYSGFYIDKRITTVSEYLSIKRSFKEYVEYLKKNNKG